MKKIIIFLFTALLTCCVHTGKAQTKRAYSLRDKQGNLITLSFYQNNNFGYFLCYVNGALHCNMRVNNQTATHLIVGDCENQLWAITLNNSVLAATLIVNNRFSKHTAYYYRSY